jgi:cell fate (sporulation/competence/biofilm development) regulator YmcA (YheA/YmcA/DUF963 family)
MSKEIDEAIEKIKGDIDNDPLIMRYLKLEELISSSESLNSLKKEIDFLKKCNINEEEKVKYKDLLNKYNSDPLVIEFKNISDEVYNLLEEIKEEIES